MTLIDRQPGPGLPGCLQRGRRALAPGDMMPSITRLTQDYGVSKDTAVKALEVLRREGLTRTVAGGGTFVAKR